MIKYKFVKQLQKEFKELNELFFNEVFKNSKERAKARKYYKKYNSQKLIELYNSLGYNINENDNLYEVLTFLIETGYKDQLIKHKNSSLFIPLFVMLLDGAPAENDKFFEYCMKVHLSKDKEGLFLNDELNKCSIPFDSRIIDTLEMVMYAPSFSADLRTVLNLLDYIDYEEIINGSQNSDYYLELAKHKKDLEAYVSFIACDELYDNYLSTRHLIEKNYNNKNVYFTNDSINLLRHFVDINVLEYKNKFYQFKELEKKLKESGTDLERKNRMLAAFTYRSYPDDFYDDFNDINLSREDLINFVKTYEISGGKFSKRQINNLLLSFRNRLIYQNGKLDEYNYLFDSVQKSYKRYRKNHYAFKPEEFIKDYNKNNRNNRFNLFNFEDGKLNRDVFEFIINGNLLCGLSELKDTSLYNDYINFNNLDLNYEKVDDDNFNTQKYIYSTYMDVIKGLFKEKTITNRYFIKRNVLEKDMPLFNDLLLWYETHFDKVSYDDSIEAKISTLKLLNEDLYLDLLNGNFSERGDIVDKYYDFAKRDNLFNIMPKHMFYKILHVYEDDFSNSTGRILYDELVSCYLNNENMFEVISKYNLALNDLEVVLGMIKIDEEKDVIKPGTIFNIIIEKLKDEPKALMSVKCEKREEMKKQDAIKLLSDFVYDDNYVSTKQYLISHGYSKCRLSSARQLLGDDSEICKLYDAKVKYLNDSEEHVTKWLTDSIRNGVVRNDGTIRPFNYLDYLLGTDYPITSLKKVRNGFARKFVFRHSNLDRYNEENMIDQRMVLNINGEVHEVTEEEKRKALHFIDAMSLPHAVIIFDQVVKESLNGDLKIEGELDLTPKHIIVKK